MPTKRSKLDTLVSQGIVARTSLPPPTAVQLYGLTAWGHLLGGAVDAIEAWWRAKP